MATDPAASNVTRGHLFLAIGEHLVAPLNLDVGESFQCSYSLSSGTPTVSFTGTLKVSKVFDESSMTLAVAPWFEPTSSS